MFQGVIEINIVLMMIYFIVKGIFKSLNKPQKTAVLKVIVYYYYLYYVAGICDYGNFDSDMFNKMI